MNVHVLHLFIRHPTMPPPRPHAHVLPKGEREAMWCVHTMQHLHSHGPEGGQVLSRSIAATWYPNC